MSSNETSLLFRLRGENAQLKSTIADSRSAIASLRGSVGTEFGQINRISTQSLGAVSQSLTQVTSQIPVVGSAVSSLSSHLGTMSVASEGAAAGVAGLAGPLSIAVIGIAATVTAVTTLGTQLFNFAKTAADVQDKLDDLSQQTGVNVETLSALEILVKSSGGSIDSLAQSLVVFQGKLDDAQDSTSKAGKQFRELGISTSDTETALRDALSVLSQMPEGFNQTNTAAELFGRRGARQFLGVLKEAHGDLDGAIRRLKELGVVISDADAKAASDFNKQLDLLNFQLRAVGIAIGKEIIPVALEAIKDLSTALKDNKEAINTVATAAGLLSNLFTGPLKGSIILIEDQWERLRPILETTAELYERIAAAARLVTGRTDFGTSAAGVVGAGLGDLPEVGGDAGFKLPGLKSGLFKRALEESTAEAQKELELQRHLTEELRLDHERRGNDLELFYDRQQRLLDERYVTLTGQISRERGAVLAAFARGEIDQAEADKRSADLDLRSTQAKNKNDEETRRLTLEKDRALVQQELKLREGLASIEAARREGELSRLEASLDRQATVESEVLTKRLDFVKATHKERIGIIDFEIKAESTSAERKAELNTEKIVLEQKYTDEVKRLARERMDALAAEAAAGQPGIGGTAPGLDFFSGIGRAIEDSVGPPPTEIFDAWADAFTTLKDIGANAMSELAFGVGSLIENWVLLGSIGPQAIRKFTASVLAGVAAQAAVKAIFELAEGFAALFRNPAEAGAHFTSAAIFGSIAGVAAAAGRVIAGNAFQTGSGASGGSSGSKSGSGSSSSGSSGAPKAVDVDRRSFDVPASFTINLGLQEGIVADHFRRDYLLNGPTRLIIKTDGQG